MLSGTAWRNIRLAIICIRTEEGPITCLQERLHESQMGEIVYPCCERRRIGQAPQEHEPCEEETRTNVEAEHHAIICQDRT